MLYKLCKLCLFFNFFQPREEIYYTSLKKINFWVSLKRQITWFRKISYAKPKKSPIFYKYQKRFFMFTLKYFHIYLKQKSKKDNNSCFKENSVHITYQTSCHTSGHEVFCRQCYGFLPSGVFILHPFLLFKLLWGRQFSLKVGRA